MKPIPGTLRHVFNAEFEAETTKAIAMKNLALLNAVQKLLIDFANKKGISLADEFETVDEFKKFVIAFTVKNLTDLGMSVQTALDLTLGDGTYDRIVESTWNAAQSA